MGASAAAGRRVARYRRWAEGDCRGVGGWGEQGTWRRRRDVEEEKGGGEAGRCEMSRQGGGDARLRGPSTPWVPVTWFACEVLGQGC